LIEFCKLSLRFFFPRGIGIGERPLALTLGIDALVDLYAQMAFDKRRWLGPRQIVKPRHPLGADIEDVAETLRRDQTRTRAL
jgi:hypothetical protein